MARPCSTIPNTESRDVEQSIEVLDKVLSEFEDPDSLPPIAIEPDSPSQDNHSEDDGYMSMNGRRNFPQLNDNLKDRIVNVKRFPNNFCPEPGAEKLTLQTTLPKTRQFTAVLSRFSSLPCASPSRTLLNRGASFDIADDPGHDEVDEAHGGGRTVLGIGISAVHDAVLRGVARIPVSIVNEHPVTIYPGRASPTRRSSNRQLCNEVRSRDSSRMLEPEYAATNHHHVSSTSPSIVHPSQLSFSLDPPPSGEPLDSLSSNHQPFDRDKLHHSDWETRSNKRKSSDCEDFSDDSLEGLSLPPPPPSIIVPPPPSLSAPVTPNKRASVAWEIRLDVRETTSPRKQQHHTPQLEPESPNRIAAAATSPSESHSSLSTSDKSATSPSIEWPEPPEMPVCSTEDEAGSLYSDSEEFLLNIPNEIKDNGTYVIRKGRRERHLLSDLIMAQPPPKLSPIHSSNSSSKNPIAENHLVKANSMFVSAISRPFSRHSIDLGLASAPPMPSQQHHHSGAHHPRSRLSLDLSSPTSELPPPPPSTTPLLNHPTTSTISTSITRLNSPPFNATAGATSTGHYGGSSNNLVLSPRYNEFKQYSSTFDALHALDVTNSNNSNYHTSTNTASANKSRAYCPFTQDGASAAQQEHHHQLLHHSSSHLNNNDGGETTCGAGAASSLKRVSSVPSMSPAHSGELISTPRRELAPPIEEDEEQDSESFQGVAPLRQIENNISALLRGDIIVARVGSETSSQARKPLGFRPGVHKSESAKEMLLSQSIFGPLPPSPPATPSSPEEADGFPPLPPSPPDDQYLDSAIEIMADVTAATTKCSSLHGKIKPDRERGKPRESSLDRPPAVPPHRGPSINTLKTRSMDAGFSKSNRHHHDVYTSPNYAGVALPATTTNNHETIGSNTRRRYMSGAFPKRAAQSPREERRLQTSCSLPETPIFARGCDIPRTPHRRAPDLPGSTVLSGGSRTAPRPSMGLNSSIIVGTSIGNRQKSISQAFAGGEMLRLSGGPARGWYPRQRQARPVSTENLDRLHAQSASVRAWDSGTAGRKPLTLPPNMSPKFFNKSPREALRRVTSLLIRGKGNGQSSGVKESKREKEFFSAPTVNHTPGASADEPTTPHKKKGFFKNFWKKSKHYSLEQ